MQALPITGAFPPVWVSDVDAQDPAAGIYCNQLDPQWGRLATGVAKRLVRILK